MPGGHRSRARGRGFAYWFALLVGCLAVVVVVGLVYIHFQPAVYPHILPTPSYSHGPGGLYDSGVTVIPNPPVTHAPAP